MGACVDCRQNRLTRSFFSWSRDAAEALRHLRTFTPLSPSQLRSDPEGLVPTSVCSSATDYVYWRFPAFLSPCRNMLHRITAVLALCLFKTFPPHSLNLDDRTDYRWQNPRSVTQMFLRCWIICPHRLSQSTEPLPIFTASLPTLIQILNDQNRLYWSIHNFFFPLISLFFF